MAMRATSSMLVMMWSMDWIADAPCWRTASAQRGTQKAGQRRSSGSRTMGLQHMFVPLLGRNGCTKGLTRGPDLQSLTTQHKWRSRSRHAAGSGTRLRPC